MKYAATQLSIIAEQVFEPGILQLLSEEGAKGYTIYQGGGKGAFTTIQLTNLQWLMAFRSSKLKLSSTTK